MIVTTIGKVMSYDELPLGSIFVSDHSGKPCICLNVGSKSQNSVVAFFNPFGGEDSGPVLAQFANVSMSDSVLNLGEGELVPDAIADLSKPGEDWRAGDLAISGSKDGTQQRYHLAVKSSNSVEFINLGDSLVEGRTPSTGLQMRCRKWRIQVTGPSGEKRVLGEWPPQSR